MESNTNKGTVTPSGQPEQDSTMSVAIVKVEPMKLIGFELEGLTRTQLAAVDNERLCAAVLARGKFFHEVFKAWMPLVVELRERFYDLEKGESIGGFTTWTAFCTQAFNHSYSYIRQLMRSNGAINPAAKHDGSKKRLKSSNRQIADSGSEAVAAAELKRKLDDAFEQGRIAERNKPPINVIGKPHRTVIAPTPTVPVEAATRLGIADELVAVILNTVGDDGLVSTVDGKIFRNLALRYESAGRPSLKPEPPQPKKTSNEQQAEETKAEA